jgi:hypothetical protein
MNRLYGQKNTCGRGEVEIKKEKLPGHIQNPFGKLNTDLRESREKKLFF